MLNRITVQGRLTRDPELRRTQSGISVVSFSVAVDRDTKNDNGDRETDFIDVVAWRNTAEFVANYFGKGKMALIDGRLQIRDWTDREGQKRRTAEILANSVYFGESKRDAGDSGDYTRQNTGRGSASRSEAKGDELPIDADDFDDDNLPF